MDARPVAIAPGEGRWAGEARAPQQSPTARRDHRVRRGKKGGRPCHPPRGDRDGRPRAHTQAGPPAGGHTPTPLPLHPRGKALAGGKEGHARGGAQTATPPEAGGSALPPHPPPNPGGWGVSPKRHVTATTSVCRKKEIKQQRREGKGGRGQRGREGDVEGTGRSGSSVRERGDIAARRGQHCTPRAGCASVPTPPPPPQKGIATCKQHREGEEGGGRRCKGRRGARKQRSPAGDARPRLRQHHAMTAAAALAPAPIMGWDYPPGKGGLPVLAATMGRSSGRWTWGERDGRGGGRRRARRVGS